MLRRPSSLHVHAQLSRVESRLDESDNRATNIVKMQKCYWQLASGICLNNFTPSKRFMLFFGPQEGDASARTPHPIVVKNLVLGSSAKPPEKLTD